MHFHLPKPLHGWREFAGEVGIIVIGVLIALSAEQVVDDLHWRHEVHGFRTAVDHEIGRNLDVWQVMTAERPCVTRRIDDLDRFLAASTAGRQLHLLRPIGRPASYSPYFSVWDNKSADVTAHLPLDARLKYAEIYDELHNQEINRTGERDVWRELARFDQPEPLDHQDRMMLRALLTRAKSLNAVEIYNADLVARLAGRLGIRALHVEQTPHMAEDDICQPLLAS